ncbi:LPXTG cell wall anchor domain-containing protein [Pontibacter sp. MBLB2868]|uniref:LPXTG cell wall anchor domain-containing protein n=1 Tax=Pontibacter sp. MBLB2868 TaxID=3451555 RepID=UPI003F74BEE9
MEQVTFQLNPADLQYGLQTTGSKGSAWLLWIILALAVTALLLLLLREEDPPPVPKDLTDPDA